MEIAVKARVYGPRALVITQDAKTLIPLFDVSGLYCGLVHMVGDGRFELGRRHQLEMENGDVVLFSDFLPVSFKSEGGEKVEAAIVHEDDIVMVFPTNSAVKLEPPVD